MADKDVTEPQQSDDDARPETEASAAASNEVTSDSTSSNVDKELLVGAGAASSLRPKRKAAAAEVEPAESSRKGRATRKRAEALEEHKAPKVGPVTFIQQSAAELKKVVWPTGDQLRQYFIVVLVFVLIVIAYVSGLDALFGWLLLQLLG